MTKSNSSCVKVTLAEDGKTWVTAPLPEESTLTWRPEFQALLDSMSEVPDGAEPSFFQALLMTPDLLEPKRIPL